MTDGAVLGDATAADGLLVSLPARTMVARRRLSEPRGAALWRRPFEAPAFEPLDVGHEAGLRFDDPVPDPELPLLHVLTLRHRVRTDDEGEAVDEYAFDSVRSYALPDGAEVGRCDRLDARDGDDSWIVALIGSAGTPLKVLAHMALSFPDLAGRGHAVRHRLAEIDLATGRATSLSPLPDAPARPEQ